MASACGLLSTRKNLGKGMEQAEPLTLHVLGREWMYTDTCRESFSACLPGYAPKSLLGIRERNRGQSELKRDKIVKGVRREKLYEVQGRLTK